MQIAVAGETRHGRAGQLRTVRFPPGYCPKSAMEGDANNHVIGGLHSVGFRGSDFCTRLEWRNQKR